MFNNSLKRNPKSIKRDIKAFNDFFKDFFDFVSFIIIALKGKLLIYNTLNKHFLYLI